MKDGFYEERLRNLHQIEVLLPAKKQQEYINSAIYKELARGKLYKKTKNHF
jgi:aspartate/glutamate racemase